MRYCNYKKIIGISIVSILLFFNSVLAQSSMKDLLTAAGETGAGFKDTTGETTLSENIGSIIRYLLSFLGVIFIVLVIYGGFLWMTARGDQEQITKAKDIIRNSVIGLVIVLAAYSITYTIIYYFFLSVGL